MCHTTEGNNPVLEEILDVNPCDINQKDKDVIENLLISVENHETIREDESDARGEPPSLEAILIGPGTEEERYNMFIKRVKYHLRDDFNQREGEREKEKEEREKEELKTREMGKCEAEEKEKREISEAWEKEKEMNLEDLLESLDVGKRRSADEPMENNNEA
ncbi:hypothetical protein ADUPG1_002021, partial [Aduncisulcus paluster]